MKNLSLHLPFLAASAALLLAACGQSEESTPATTSAAPVVPPAASAATTPAVGRAIEITGNDSMKFSVTEIRAKPGEALSITLLNVGSMPKFSMGHNWVLLPDGVDPVAFANDAAMSAKTNYVPAAYADRVLAATKLLGPKESDTVTFNAPIQPGRYVFLCSFPGHFQVGMKGELIVE